MKQTDCTECNTTAVKVYTEKSKSKNTLGALTQCFSDKFTGKQMFVQYINANLYFDLALTVFQLSILEIIK